MTSPRMYMTAASGRTLALMVGVILTLISTGTYIYHNLWLSHINLHWLDIAFTSTCMTMFTICYCIFKQHAQTLLCTTVASTSSIFITASNPQFAPVDADRYYIAYQHAYQVLHPFSVCCAFWHLAAEPMRTFAIAACLTASRTSNCRSVSFKTLSATLQI